jgi:hypothetical protein
MEFYEKCLPEKLPPSITDKTFTMLPGIMQNWFDEVFVNSKLPEKFRGSDSMARIQSTADLDELALRIKEIRHSGFATSQVWKSLHDDVDANCTLTPERATVELATLESDLVLSIYNSGIEATRSNARFGDFFMWCHSHDINYSYGEPEFEQGLSSPFTNKYLASIPQWPGEERAKRIGKVICAIQKFCKDPDFKACGLCMMHYFKPVLNKDIIADVSAPPLHENANLELWASLVLDKPAPDLVQINSIALLL